ncbi:hypothetical protein [Okeania sp. SIO1H4]|uniref:hypothetical protein n=1 Tax=Okeania sp. SIO1H4 TaxID=2607776 RepID=UPI0013CDBEDE|nr:hypothetical protein [Okeania sp. SIO1H4]NES79940.1 hypothetical protein [Okeania sp. SIO1H4]
MRILYKIFKHIRKHNLKKIFGIAIVVFGLRYARPDPSISSNPSKQIERKESYFKDDPGTINTNAILIKSENGILISDSRTSKNLNKLDIEQIILVKTGDSGPSSPPVNSISRGGFVNSDPSKNSKPSNSDCKVPFRAAPGGSDDPGNGAGASWEDASEENNVPEQSKWNDDKDYWKKLNPSFSQPKDQKPEQCELNLDEKIESETEENQSQIKPPGKFKVDSDHQVDIDFDYELDKNGRPVLLVPIKDNTVRRVEFDQTRDKFYHEDLFPNISPPDGFNNKAVRALEYPDRLAYLRKNIPAHKVIELQNEIAKSLSDPNIISVPGFLGKYKISGTIDINQKSGLVSFTDAVTDKHRTTVKMKSGNIKKLAKDDFHLFPDK